MMKFDPAKLRERLLGDCGIDFYLKRKLEDSQAVGGLASSADGYIDEAIECLLVGSDDAAQQLLKKAHDWIRVAIDTNEIPQRHVPDGTEAFRFHTLAMCNWLLYNRLDTDSLMRFVQHEDRFMPATGLDKQRQQVILVTRSYLDAGAYERALDLIARARVPLPKTLTAVRNEGQMVYVLARHQLGLESWSDPEVLTAVQRFPNRSMNTWLLDGLWDTAAEWLKIVYWQEGRAGLSPKQTILKAYEHLPKADTRPS